MAFKRLLASLLLMQIYYRICISDGIIIMRIIYLNWHFGGRINDRRFLVSYSDNLHLSRQGFGYFP
jgi:hypothetical protein